MIKNEIKIREYLGSRYHLFVEIKKDEKISWKLFEIYLGWMMDNSGPIMDSERNTEEELFEFAKKHREYNESYILGKSMIIIAIINFLVAIANCFFKNVFLRGFINGVNFAMILICFIRLIISNKNLKVSELRLKEAIERKKRRNK